MWTFQWKTTTTTSWKWMLNFWKSVEWLNFVSLVAYRACQFVSSCVCFLLHSFQSMFAIFEQQSHKWKPLRLFWFKLNINFVRIIKMWIVLFQLVWCNCACVNPIAYCNTINAICQMPSDAEIFDANIKAIENKSTQKLWWNESQQWM